VNAGNLTGMRIYLITHAHTEQVAGVAADTWQLSLRGVEQASKLAESPIWTQISQVVISSEPKTWLTVETVVRQRHLPVWIDSRFDELRRSEWIEDYAAQVAKVFAQPVHPINGWEAAETVRLRALAGLADLSRRFPDQTLAVVGHGLCLSIVRSAILGHQQADFSTWRHLSFATHALISLHPSILIDDFETSSQVAR
jgi:broad specificity phosphatase PhoE